MGWREEATERAAALGLAPPADAAPAAPKRVPTGTTFDADLIPSNDPTSAAGDSGMDTLLDGLDIIDAYNRWCGKMVPDPGGKRESIMVSCPNPRHADTNPSAWINLDNQTYFCGGCQEGGDKYDIAAWGLDVPDYKSKRQFPELRRQMATALGYTVERTIGGQTLVRPHADPDDLPLAAVPDPDRAPPLSECPLATVTTLMPAVPTGAPVGGWPTIDWRSIFPAGTFLHKWMVACSKDDLPDEYYVWLGLLAVSMACGNDVTMNDTKPVRPNLFVCLLGPTGVGKTRSISALEGVLSEALPYDYDDPRSKGVAQIPNPGSAEALVDSFSRPIKDDPLDTKKVTGYGEVRGLLEINEFADLVAGASRGGNKIKPMLIGLYDKFSDTVVNSRGSGTVRAAKPFCSVVTSTQPESIRDLIVDSDTSSGFGNRWIFVAGRPKKLVALGRGPLDLSSTIEPLMTIHGWAEPGRSIDLQPEAAEVFTAFFDEHIAPGKQDEQGNDLHARVDLTLKKLIVLFAANEGVLHPNVDLVERALSLHSYLLSTYGIVTDKIGYGEFNDCMAAALKVVREWNQAVSPSVYLIHREVPKRFQRDMLIKAVNHLVLFEEIVEILPPAGHRGRPTTRYRAVQ